MAADRFQASGGDRFGFADEDTVAPFADFSLNRASGVHVNGNVHVNGGDDGAYVHAYQ
jgi:hypothetical protein